MHMHMHMVGKDVKIHTLLRYCLFLQMLKQSSQGAQQHQLQIGSPTLLVTSLYLWQVSLCPLALVCSSVKWVSF